jgi:hypothetical protein
VLPDVAEESWFLRIEDRAGGLEVVVTPPPSAVGEEAPGGLFLVLGEERRPMMPKADGTWHAVVSPETEGSVSLRLEDDGGIVRDEAAVTVGPPPEIRRFGPDRAMLSEITALTGGRLHELDEAATPNDRPAHPLGPFQGHLLVAAALGLLLVERAVAAAGRARRAPSRAAGPLATVKSHR